jgi:hypothetical protein
MIDDLQGLIESYKENPDREYPISTTPVGILRLSGSYKNPLTGKSFRWDTKEEPGKGPQQVVGPSQRTYSLTGVTYPVLGTILFGTERLRNMIPAYAPVDGIIIGLRSDLDGQRLESGTPVLVVRHRITADEVIAEILQEELEVYTALVGGAKYHLHPDLRARLDEKGVKAVEIRPGEPMLIKLQMKQEEIIQ